MYDETDDVAGEATRWLARVDAGRSRRAHMEQRIARGENEQQVRSEAPVGVTRSGVALTDDDGMVTR